MENNQVKITILGIIILICIPVVTFSFLNFRQEKIREENYLKIMEEEKIKREAEEKIYLMGKFELAERNDFVLIPTYRATNGSSMYLRREAYKAFQAMATAAEKDGIKLKIASATRNFDYQKTIWEAKWSGATLVNGKNLSQSTPDGTARFTKILEYSAAPGTSRHHWGTDIDINAAIPSYFNGEEGIRVYNWLKKNALSFGFCQTYDLKGSQRPSGYNEEKWHWSYLPLARDFTKEYENLIQEENIQGFAGDEYVSNFDLIHDYVLSINPNCI